jgi:Zn-dependent peptidase ImmA (M78 family)
MDLTLYKPTELENWLNQRYQQAGIYYPFDLDIDRVADIFGVEVGLYDGKNVADWLDGSHSFILLNAYMKIDRRREVFFHELCHPIQHVGLQDTMSKMFKNLQETQAAQFQPYAAMPIYMLEEFKYISPSLLVKAMAEEFILPEAFVRRRLEQIERRIHFTQLEREADRIRNTKIVIDEDHVRHVMAELGRRQKEREGA